MLSLFLSLLVVSCLFFSLCFFVLFVTSPERARHPFICTRYFFFKLKISSNTFWFQPCQAHTYRYQAPFERRRRAKRVPRIFQRTHTDHPSSAGGTNAHIPNTRQSEASPTPCATHTYQAPLIVSICLFSYVVPAYLLETPLGHNRIGSPFKILRQNRVPWED